jgi:selenocysteine lyase/cysteine desulfurase
MRDHKINVSADSRDAGPVVRMAPGIVNTEGEIDATLEVLRKIV